MNSNRIKFPDVQIAPERQKQSLHVFL